MMSDNMVTECDVIYKTMARTTKKKSKNVARKFNDDFSNNESIY